MIKQKYLVNKDTPDFYLDLVITINKNTRYEDTIVHQAHDFMLRYNRPYTPPVYATKMVKYIEDCITINMIDRETNRVVLSITSKADINIGDDIPNSSNVITKGLMKEFLRMRKE